MSWQTKPQNSFLQYDKCRMSIAETCNECSLVAEGCWMYRSEESTTDVGGRDECPILVEDNEATCLLSFVDEKSR
ncbi:unnamed protein product [Larinioides sclopetarius]|uniref:Uncharacterized protein n=1 Tax=Larinioides sclopetarius TaxID=280406 RepID=A0AAV1YW40_9ARAC